MKNQNNKNSVRTFVRTKALPAFNKNLSFLVFLVTLFSVRWSLADHYRVPSGSMQPSIEIGDHIVVDKTAYQLKLPFTDIILKKTGEPKHGDVVVFTSPLSAQPANQAGKTDSKIRMVKRLIGLPGDIIEIEKGFVSVNGAREAYTLLEDYNREALLYFHVRILERSYALKRNPKLMKYDNEKITLTVPQDSYFMMGDNRDNSYDSRFWGFVPRSNLIGKAIGVAFNAKLDRYIPKMDLSRIGKAL
jgi:signal peptidase I